MNKEQKQQLREAIIKANNPDCKDINEALKNESSYEITTRDNSSPYNCLTVEYDTAPPTLERVLVALESHPEDEYIYGDGYMVFLDRDGDGYIVFLDRDSCCASDLFRDICTWQLGKNLFEQPESTQDAIYNIICKNA